MKLTTAPGEIGSEKMKPLCDLMLDEASFYYMDDGPCKDYNEIKQRLEKKEGRLGCNPEIESLWYVEEDGLTVGYVHFKNYLKEHNRVELNLAISMDYRGKGLASAVLKAAIDMLFEKTDLRLVIAACRSINVGSHKAMEKAGMSRQATLKEWVLLEDGTPGDCYWYSITRSRWEGDRG